MQKQKYEAVTYEQSDKFYKQINHSNMTSAYLQNKPLVSNERRDVQFRATQKKELYEGLPDIRDTG